MGKLLSEFDSHPSSLNTAGIRRIWGGARIAEGQSREYCTPNKLLSSQYEHPHVTGILSWERSPNTVLKPCGYEAAGREGLVLDFMNSQKIVKKEEKDDFALKAR